MLVREELSIKKYGRSLSNTGIDCQIISRFGNAGVDKDVQAPKKDIILMDNLQETPIDPV